MGRKKLIDYTNMPNAEKSEQIIKRQRNTEAASRHRARNREKLIELDNVKTDCARMRLQLLEKDKHIERLMAENCMLRKYIIAHPCVSSSADRQKEYDVFYRPQPIEQTQQFPVCDVKNPEPRIPPVPQPNDKPELTMLPAPQPNFPNFQSNQPPSIDNVGRHYPIEYNIPNYSRPSTLGEGAEPLVSTSNIVMTTSNAHAMNLLKTLSLNSPLFSVTPNALLTPSDLQYGNLLNQPKRITPNYNLFCPPFRN